ncbi:MAG: clostripain-related cysteine peptidase, partial [Candidatus Thermoplasmatota archaeon]|nr:clostripain-related cysteine peptidase [Candidatus Thermoplasmatota archaeon]
MYLRNKILVLSLISLIVFGSVPISAGTSSQLAEQPEMKVQEKALAKWTVLTYMDGDNDLGYKYNAHIADKQEMELVGSTSEVNILIEFDSHPSVTDPAYRASARYYVKSGYSEQILVEEQDMTDPRSLVESIRWAMSDYPSEKFCLVLWNHGIGWIGMNRDDTTGEDYYELELEQLKEALYIIKQETGKKIDVILFDMCLMGMLEIAYQLDGLADYIVFSEDKIPVDSRKYQDTLADLVENSTWTAERLAQEWVYDYVGSGGMITQSAVNMSRLPSLIEAMKNFAYLLKENIDTYSTAINNAINSVKDYSVDLPSLGS